MSEKKWYEGISRYQWLVLIIASLGWVFDVYEGQIFNITRADMLKEVLGTDSTDHPDVKFFGEVFLAVFLLGGMFGGLLFGSLADKYGRKKIMIATILTYSLFSGLTYFAQTAGQVAFLRFFVAMGVGGEWAVAAALVAEEFPKRARAYAGSIFHASSVFGTWLATLAGMLVATEWRYAYLIGVLPALLVVWVRFSMKEPDRWKKGKGEGEKKKKAGSLLALFQNRQLASRAILGMLLAGVGLGTFWAGLVSTQALVTEQLTADGMDPATASSKGKFAYGLIQTAGGGLGLLLFGPISTRLGRRPTFILFHLAALVMVLIVCLGDWSYSQYLAILPFYGFFALGIHAGYAVYFPELFPTHLRGTGTSFCFNAGRSIAAGMLFVSGFVKAQVPLNLAMAWLSVLFLVGVVVVFFMPETKDLDLPEGDIAH